MEDYKTRSKQNDDDKKSSPRQSRFKKRVCRLCQDNLKTLDFKKSETLVRFVSNKGKILPRRLSGSCAKHQRVVAKTIKRARAAGFMPYTSR